MNDLYKKYGDSLKAIMFFIPLIFASYKYLSDYIDVPKKQVELEQKIISLQYQMKKSDSLNLVQSEFLRQDYQILINNGLVK
jgi:hypothetical protein